MSLHIVNVGSSFAAGPGIPPQIDRFAGRSGENYAHIVARKLGAKLTDLSVSGATLLNLLNEPQQVTGRTFGPQISEIPEDADVVLVLGGGNDIGYIGGLFGDSFNAYLVYRVVSQAYTWLTGTSAEETSTLSMEGLAARYGTVLDAINAKVPRAQVIVVEYLILLGSDLKPGVDVPFDASLLENHRVKAEQVRMATVKAIQGREQWCARVPVAEASVGHGLGSQAAWVNGFGLETLYRMAAYHPNAQGMIAVADLVMQRLTVLGLVT
ncbi:SGNH hydrolase-type esterase domain-containing protein [Xylariales sp. AK1849]|nr:SGNH hydrolase-type esterase domain-containing protein [Xylariales sp. AK1849]